MESGATPRATALSAAAPATRRRHLHHGVGLATAGRPDDLAWRSRRSPLRGAPWSAVRVRRSLRRSVPGGRQRWHRAAQWVLDSDGQVAVGRTKASWCALAAVADEAGDHCGGARGSPRAAPAGHSGFVPASVPVAPLAGRDHPHRPASGRTPPRAGASSPLHQVVSPAGDEVPGQPCRAYRVRRGFGEGNRLSGLAGERVSNSAHPSLPWHRSRALRVPLLALKCVAARNDGQRHPV
jgi:hypothetical protein